MKINEVTVKRGKTLTYEEIKVFGNNLKIIDDLKLCVCFNQVWEKQRTLRGSKKTRSLDFKVTLNVR